MSDTHINAYFGDVDEKQKLVDVANAELEASKARLEVKKKEVGYVEPETPEATDVPKEEVKELETTSTPFKKK